MNLQHHDFDICERKSRRSATSFEAHESIKFEKSRMRDEILKWAKTFGPFTLKDAMEAFGITSANKISGRLSELKRDGEIYETGQRREKCAVHDIARAGEQFSLF